MTPGDKKPWRSHSHRAVIIHGDIALQRIAKETGTISDEYSTVPKRTKVQFHLSSHIGANQSGDGDTKPCIKIDFKLHT